MPECSKAFDCPAGGPRIRTRGIQFLVEGRPARSRESPRVFKAIARLLILLLLCASYGCTRSAEVLAEEQRLTDLQNRLDNLKESIKDLPRLQEQVRQLEAENRKLVAQLKKRHK